MTATLRVMLDQLVAPTDPDLATAARELTRGLVAGTPAGCEVQGIAPAGPTDRPVEIPGLVGVRRTALARRELAAALQFGLATGIGGGMIHSPTLLAPLVRHDRVHENDQTVVTIWDLGPWEAPADWPKPIVSWHRAMLKRAVKHADAVVVPTHSMAVRLGEIAKLGERIRVIAGAAPAGFAVPGDEVGRRRQLDLPDGFVLLAGHAAPRDALAAGLDAVGHAALDLPVVVIGAGEGEEPAIADLAAAAGIPERNLHVRGVLSTEDRAAVFGGAVVFVAPAHSSAFPWRILEALALGVPVVAASSPIHDELVVDGGMLVPADGLADALGRALGSAASVERLGVLAADRGRAYSWRESADRVWQLHADL
ncbi:MULTISPECIES: glycosyltransferase [unclassified Microbacterium]|uniref:glycosyltransferase n=1 Tax=unclassified Microbacterium TaxID=2609290 RepID=UPI00214BCA4C|nr:MULTISPECIES: glycosyltransferase [unclassified Microbacterium]MCR2810282.1 glycosyltransferase [Microbacterium sp. zg.B185]WIM19890.1 glycosyltransferase [Microbacterium sp. zg-B185]